MKKNSYTCWLLSVLLLLCSCGEEESRIINPTPGENTGEVSLDLSVEVVGMRQAGAGATRTVTGPAMDMTFGTEAATTRADLDKGEEEKRIHSLYLIQFNGTESASTVVRSAAIVRDETDFTAAFNFSAVEATCRVYVVANYNPAVPEGTTLADFQQSMAMYLPTTTVDVDKGLPMCGYADFNPVTVVQIPQIKLQAMVAKLVVTYTAEANVFKAGEIPKLTLKNVANGTSYGTSDNLSVAHYPTSITFADHKVGEIGKTYTYYVPENISGNHLGDALTLWTERTHKTAPGNALYFEIRGRNFADDATVSIASYIGDPAFPNSFNIRRNYCYRLTGVIRNTDRADERITIFPDAYDLNMPVSGATANCYIVTGQEESEERYSYCFDATKRGNNATGVAGINYNTLPDLGTAKTARVIWQTGSGSNSTVLVSDSVYLKNNKIYFTLSEKLTTGNAVIGLFASDDITAPCLWSWHIWRVNGKDKNTIPGTVDCVKLLASTNAEEPFEMMDRNLGAFSNTTGLSAANGLLYQWGRKDPFPGPTTFTTAEPGNIYGDYNNGGVTGVWKGLYNIQTAVSSTTIGTETWATQYPTIFITQPASPYDWMSTKNDNLWGTPWEDGAKVSGYNNNPGTKSIYDPCPVGYRVPPQDTWDMAVKGIWTNGQALTGMVKTGSFWFPAAGYWHFGNGVLTGVSAYGNYWSSSPFALGTSTAGHLGFGSGSCSVLHSNNRAYSFSVRCVSQDL